MEFPSLSRIIKWFLLLGIYFWVTGLCTTTLLVPLSFSNNDFVQFIGTGASCLVPLVIIGGLLGGLYFLYTKDKEREESPSDDFKDTNLFFRYGYQLNHLTLTIQTKSDWSEDATKNLIQELQTRLAQKVKERFSASNIEVTLPLNIKDKSFSKDIRGFLRIIYHSIRGSQISHFIRYETAGKLIVAHYFTYARGKARWYDVADFVITGPLHFWIWIIDWFQNQHSILAAISRSVKNSYDQLDLETFFEASYLVVLTETRDFLKEKGLLSEDLERIISVNIDNSQNINITGSKGVKVGNILNRAQSAAKAFIQPES